MSIVGTRPPLPSEWKDYELHHRASIGEKFNCFRFSEAHEEGVDMFFNGSLLKERSKNMCFFRRILITGNDDT